MRRIDFLLLEARRISKNEANPDGSYAIPDEELLGYMNNAQDNIQSIISNQRSTARFFLVNKVITSVANVDGFSLSDRIFYNKQFAQVEFSATGALTDYVVIDRCELFNRDTNSSSYPVGYYTRFGLIYSVPILSTTGYWRVTYERSLDDLDKRRGTVLSVTGLTSTTFTSLTVASDADETSSPNLSTIDYICINDKDGNVLAYNIPVLSYDSTTNILVPSTFTFQTGETIPAGSFITFGKYATTHSKLFDEAERYLVHYCAESVLHKDSSDDVAKESEILQRMEDNIRRTAAAQTPEPQMIPQRDPWEWY